VDQSHLLRSIDAALATVEFLIGSLDELIAVEPNMLIAAYRVSPVLVSEGATRTTTFGGVTLVRTLIESQGQEALADALARFIKMSFPEPPWITTDCLTKEFLSECAKRALSVAIEHEEIVLVGRFLELVNSSSATTQSELAISAPCLAIRNFIQESTRSPSAFLFLVRLLNLLGWVEEWPSGISLQPHDRFDPIRLTTLGVQFTELCKSATTSWHTLGRQDLLIADQNNQSNRT
jgi:hypothetical protein